MVNLEKSPSISRALSSGVFGDNVSAAYGPNHLSNVNLPPWSRLSSAEYHPEDRENKVNTMIEMLNMHQQRLHLRGEEMKEFYRQLQSAMAMQTSKVELDTFQYAPQYVNTNTHHPANGFAAVPAQQQPWNNAQTSLLGEASDRADAEQYSHQQMAESHHENMMSLFSHESATLLQAVTSSVTPDCGNAPGSGMGGSGHWDPPQQPLSSTTFAATGEESRMQVSTMASPEGGVSTSASCHQGIRSYLCDCGVEIKRKGDLDRHRQSLQHSKRMYGCSCGKTYTRPDSLKRHMKGYKREHY